MLPGKKELKSETRELILKRQMSWRCAVPRLTCCADFLRSLKSCYLMQIGAWMLEAGCGYPVAPSFSSFFTATAQWVLAEELIQMGIISGNSQSRNSNDWFRSCLYYQATSYLTWPFYLFIFFEDGICQYLEVSLQNTYTILGMPQRASRRLQNVL